MLSFADKASSLPSSAQYVFFFFFLQIGIIINATEIIGRHLFRLVAVGINAQGWDAKPKRSFITHHC